MENLIRTGAVDSESDPIPPAPSLSEHDVKYPYRPHTSLDIPTPQNPHKILTAQDIGTRPVLVVGDVHGCIDELKELMDNVHKFHPNCLFILCGDVINKGPYSFETLRYIRSLGTAKVLSVRGNHEDHVILHWMKWQKSNKEQFPEGKFEWCVSLDEEDIHWLSELPYTISIPHLNAVIVHAGLLPGIPLEFQDSWDMTEMRDLVRSEAGELLASKHRIGKSWAAEWSANQDNEHIYFGHDARRGLQLYSRATGLDTGCVFGKQLTAKYLTGDKSMIVVNAKKVYKEKDE